MRAGDNEYFRCAQCGTLQKELTAADYAAMEVTYDPGLYLTGADRKELRAFLGVDDKKLELERIAADMGRSPSGMRLLDVGCGMGGFLAAGDELGMMVRGFEPSHTHSRVTREVWQLPVTEDYFSADKVVGEKFDIVILSHVIEHIYAPRDFIVELVSVLAPGGTLLMITPNADSLVAHATGPQWPMLVPADHVTMLTPRALDRLVPEGCTIRTRTSEYRFEFLATLLSVAKSRLRGRQVNVGPLVAEEAPKTMQSLGLAGRAVRAGLSVASFPFYLAVVGTNRASCLVTTIRAPETA